MILCWHLKVALIFGIILWMMRIGIMPRQGDIVLIPVPFTDLSSQKRRPVIVISNDAYNHTSPDVVVVAMTSNPILDAYSFTVTTNDLAYGQLNRPGTVRVAKIYTLSQTLIIKTFGQVNNRVLTHIRGLLRDLAARRQ
jgi:mRNA interferase MazF